MTVWALFILFILLCLVLDLKVFNKKDHVISTKEAGRFTTFWVSLALLFSGVIYALFYYDLVENSTGLTPTNATINYVTGYLMELSLSIDNLFVIALIMSSFKIPAEFKHRVLYWGILGAIVFRALMIVFGVTLIHRFDWMIFVFGGFLLYTAIGMLRNEEEKDPKNSWLYKQIAKLIPVSHEIKNHDFITRENGRRVATPLLMALIVIEFSDVIFALDSIPAILAITQDEFIVFSSNILAILGLRSLFFLIIGVIEKFQYIRYSLAVILAFVGLKMILTEYFIIPSLISLCIIILVLAGGILFSIWKNRRE